MNERSDHPQRRAGLAGRLLLLALSAVVALGVVEGALRLVGVESPYPVHYPGEIVPDPSAHADPRLGWKLLPHEEVRERKPEFDVVYRANAQGFRTPWDLDTRYDGDTIVFLGDSYTFGTGVAYEDTFVARIDRRLPGVRCINLGIGAFGIDQMWLTLRHHGARTRPRQVVLSFIRHDLDRSLSAYRKNSVWFAKPAFGLAGGELVEATAANPPGWWRRTFLREYGLGRLLARAGYSLGRRHPVGYRWRLNRALFAAIQRDVEAMGARLLVVHIPVNRLKPSPVYGRVMADLGIDFIDLADHLTEPADGLYYPQNGHFTAAGHAFAARVLLRSGLWNNAAPADQP